MRDDGKNILGTGESKCKALKLNVTVALSKEQEGVIGPEWRERETESQRPDLSRGLGGEQII